MLTLILSSALSFAGKHHYSTQQDFFNPARLERKMARQQARRSDLDVLRARAAESQAAVLAAEETLQRKEESLTRLRDLFSTYTEYQTKMQEILAKIGLEQKFEIKEAVKEVVAAQSEVNNEEVKVQAVTGEPSAPVDQPLTNETSSLPPMETNTVAEPATTQTDTAELPMVVNSPASMPEPVSTNSGETVTDSSSVITPTPASNDEMAINEAPVKQVLQQT